MLPYDGPGHGRAGRMRIWGLGQKLAIDVGGRTARASYFAPGADGSFSLTAGNAIAVDMSTASGAELVVVTAGFGKSGGKKKKNKKRSLVSRALFNTEYGARWCRCADSGD